MENKSLERWRNTPHGREVVRANNKAYQATHRPQMNTYRRTAYWRQRKLVEGIKLAKGCEDCGYCAHVEALDFDHLRDKAFNIASSLGKVSDVRLLAEVEKCAVRCANCHRVITAQRKNS